MKTVSVRLTAEQDEQFKQLAKLTGGSVQKFLQRGAEMFLEIEAPVYEAAFKEARKRLDK